MLDGRRVVLGVTGGIAAYKSIEISRRLVDLGAHVIPVMTAAATRFVGETTLSALASEPVRMRLWDDPDTPIPHTTVGQDADLILIAPATARFIAAARIGLADDLLSNIVLAARCPVMICPAMHTEMWEYPAVRDNIATLKAWGIHIVDPESGRLAGGDAGMGRLADPERIVAAVGALLAGGPDAVAHDGPHNVMVESQRRSGPDGTRSVNGGGESNGPGSGPLSGLRVVVSAGGTREPIDAVRVIANRSSGKQGHALAAEAASRGADVTLVSTEPVAEETLARYPGLTVIDVETCEQMRRAILSRAPQADVVIMAAAVADFRPVEVASNKLKKRDGIPQIVLEPTPDILAELGETKPDGQTLVGFAAETDDLVANAKSKLARKHLDMIVANDVSAPQVGFGHDTNSVTILSADGSADAIPLSSKRLVAAAIIDRVVSLRSKQHAHAHNPEENHDKMDV